MSRRTRVLLVEHLDAIGAAPADARARAIALRHAGCTVETVVLDGRGDDDLQFHSTERDAGPAIDSLAPGPAGLRALADRVRANRPSLVLWASAAPGGGEAAHALPRGPETLWWPTGHAPGSALPGPLPALPGFAPPCGGTAAEAARGPRQRLSLWDGPFVLVPAPPTGETAQELLDGFAAAAIDRDQVDLVVLDHPQRRLETLAHARGVGQRTHFVGPAPREAEAAWLATAAAVLVAGDAPVSGGLLLRALASGAAPVPVGAAAAPIADWLESLGCAWARPRDAAGIAAVIEAALDRAAGTQRAREAGREAAAAFAGGALPARLAAALAAAAPAARAA